MLYSKSYQIVLIAILLSATMSINKASAQDDSNMVLVGRNYFNWQPGMAALTDTFAFVSAGKAGLQVLDISDTAFIRPVGFLNLYPERADHILLKEQVAIVFGRETLQTIDVSNPFEPVLLGQCASPPPFYSVSLSGTSAFVVTDYFEYRVFDISDPSSPNQIARFSDERFTLDGFSASDSTLCIYSYMTMFVYDVTDPTSPELQGQFEIDDFGPFILDNGFLFGKSGNFQIIDIRTPDDPEVIGSCQLPEDLRATGVELSDSIACFQSNEQTVLIDISTYEEPEVLSVIDRVGNGSICDGNLIITHSSGITLYDIANPANPREVNHFISDGYGRQIDIEDSLAVVSNLDGGVVLLNITDPSSPRKLAQITLPGLVQSSRLKEQYLLTSFGTRDLWIFNIIDPSHPRFNGTYSIEDHRFSDLQIREDQLFSISDGIFIFDVWDPLHPSLLGRLQDNDNQFPIAKFDVQNDMLAGVYARQLHLFDVSDAENITLISSIDIGVGCENIELRGEFAFLACNDGRRGVVIVDVSNPSDPSILLSHRVSDQSETIAVDGNILYVGSMLEISVFDISPLSRFHTINEIGHINVNNVIKDLTAINGLLYSAEEDGMSIYRYSPGEGVSDDRLILHPSSIILSSFPSPFNSSTFITFSTPVPGPASLSLTDLSGRTIRSWTKPLPHPGEFRFSIDGSGLSAGVYWVKVAQGNQAVSRKIVLLR